MKSAQLEYVPRSDFDNTTLTERVYQNLREDILSNRLPPGTQVQEASMARALEVSRGPVREALRRLAAEGLVTLVPRRFAVVSSLSREEFLDAYRVREALEVLAIRLAIPRLTPADLARLEGLCERMEEAAAVEDIDGFFSANAEFHTHLVDRSGNLVLQDTYFPLLDQMRRYRLRSVRLRGGLTRSCEEHRRILEAIQRSDVEEGAALLRRHIQVPQTILESADSNVELELAYAQASE